MRKLIFVLPILLYSCSHHPSNISDSLELAGNNRNQIEEVIEHYKRNGENDKLRAACFLIANMKDKGTYINELVDSSDEPVGYNLYNFKSFTTENRWLDSTKEVRGPLHEKEAFLPDLEHITSRFLIDNIDQAFKVKQNSPFCKGLSDADFYEYILPYRVSYEKLEYWRDSILSEFSELKDSVYNFTNILAATNFVDNIFQERVVYGGSRYFRQKNVRCYSELLHDKVGTCNDMCNVMVMVLRALGIPVGFDYINYRRASNSNGHGWCFIIDTKFDKNYSFDALSDNGPGLFELPDKNPPKIFRKQFAIVNQNSIKNNRYIIHPSFFEDNSLDVTSQYLETVNISIPLDSMYATPVYLNIWHQGNWKPVAYTYNPNCLIAAFSQVAKDNLYCVTSYSNFENKEISEPFIVNRCGEIKYGSSLGVRKKIDLTNFKTRYLNNAKNNAIIFTFGKNKDFQKICIKSVPKELKTNKWILLSDSVESSRFYFLSDSLCPRERIFVIGEDKKSINWY